jgi:leucyl aminopeptidase (aminopeptidase T)
MYKLRDNLRVAIESGAVSVQKVAICYQKNQVLAQKIAQLLPYQTVLVDSVNAPLAGFELVGISHALELYHPAEVNYDLCRKQRAVMREQGCLLLSLYDWQENYLEDAFWGNTDYRQLPKLLDGVMQDLEQADTFHITSDLGTDILFSVKGRQWLIANGICRRGELSQMPDGELYTCPIEESFNGVLVVDGTITRSWLPREPQRLEFKQGQLIHASAEFANYIKPNGPAIYQIGEFAIGFNPAHREIVHNISVDEKAAGSVHFALGDSYNLGKNNCLCHVDMVIRNPQIETNPNIDFPFFNK